MTLLDKKKKCTDIKTHVLKEIIFQKIAEKVSLTS